MVATIPPQTSLSSVPAYTSWPGGIDPTVNIYRLPVTGGKRMQRKASRKMQRKASRKMQRKASRKMQRR